MFPQRWCQIFPHKEQQIIGLCQKDQCKQLFRKVCLQCIQELNQNDSGCQISDIMSIQQLNDILNNFQQNSNKRNEKIQKTCQINKFFLLKEFEEFMQFWRVEFNTWHYLEQISQEFTDKNKLLNIDSYIDDKQNKYNLKQFLKTLDQEGQDLIDEILSKKHNYQLQEKIKKLNIEPLEDMNKILTKLTNQVERNINMDKDNMLNFMINDLHNDEMTVSMVQKMFNYYKIWDNNNIFNGVNQDQINKIYGIQGVENSKQDIYNQKQICRKGLLLLSLRKVEEALKYFNLLIDQFPQNCQAHYHKARILEDQKKFKDAIECLNLCIKQNRNYRDAYYQKADILLDQKNFKEAIECLDLCIKLNPNY